MSTPTSTDRQAQLAAVHDKLARAVDALLSGDDWRRAMEFAATFRSRSFNNALLIRAQHAEAYEQGRVLEPVPKIVAGYRQWQSVGHQVHRGAPGYAILAPAVAHHVFNPERGWSRLTPGENLTHGDVVHTAVVGAKVDHVWDVSSTDGPPLPLPPAPNPLPGTAPARLWEGLAQQITAHGFTLRTVPNALELGGACGVTNFGANGVTNYEARTVSLRDDRDAASKCRTLGHELTHILLDGPYSWDAPFHEGIAEVEAESVTMMLLAAHRMDTSQFAVPQVSTWASSVRSKQPGDVIAATAHRVRKTALTILDRLDTLQVGTGDPPGLDRAPHPTRGVEHGRPGDPPPEASPDLGLDLPTEPEGVTW